MANKVHISKRLNDLLTKKAGRLAKQALNNPKLANRIKNRILLSIKKDGVMPSGRRVKAKSPGYTKALKRLEKNNKTSRFYSRFFSNLTFTGSFLNSFKAKIIQKAKTVIFDLGPTGDHKAHRNANGKKSKPVTNSELGRHIISNGRDYTEISEQTKQAITKSMKSAILREFKLNLKRK